jgi:surfeit locus 1 family protein
VAVPAASSRRSFARIAFATAIVLACLGFLALGIWQLERRVWKLDLIARVEERVHAAPLAAPVPDDWPAMRPGEEEYRHLVVAGRYLAGRDTFVHASTRLGAGYWVLTPFVANGGIYLINRGFVESAHADPPPIAQDLAVTGLLRTSEPRGTLLKDNDPAGDRWYSRDVEAIAGRRGLQRVAPFFIDADASSSTPSGQANQAQANVAQAGQAQPVAGLTVVHFPNNHLEYALTWFGLALLSGWALARLPREPGK